MSRWLALCLTAGALAATPPVAPTPPMGWNSCGAFGNSVREDEVKFHADFLAKHLKHYGWEYIVVDIEWFRYNVSCPGALTTHNGPWYLDRYGRPIPAPEYFPSAAGGRGFRPLAGYIHQQGLKFGIHIMRGVPRPAVRGRSPVLGTSLTAADIADTTSVCPWSKDMYGVDPRKPGAQEWYDSLFRQYAEWGVDLVKMDDASQPYHPGEIELARKAIERSGRPILLSLSPGPAPLAQAEHLRTNAEMWRTTADVFDRWRNPDSRGVGGDIYHAFEIGRNWTGQAAGGHWPDPDFLMLGRLGERSGDYGVPGGGNRLTREEQLTCATLWHIMRSPLMISCNLKEIDDWTLGLLTNAEAVDIVKSSHGNRELFRRDDVVAWTAEGADRRYLALFNLNDDERLVRTSLSELGLRGTWALRDIWGKRDLNTTDSEVVFRLPAHGSRLLKLTFLQ